MILKPPTGLHVELVAANGARARWGSDDSDAGNRPGSVSFTTARGDGFKTATVTLARDPRRDYPDFGLYDTIRLIGHGGTVAWEGRIASRPADVDGATRRINVQAVGWMAHARDRKFVEIYVDRDLAAWANPPSQTRRGSQLVSNFSQNDATVSADKTGGSPALISAVQGAWAAPGRPASEALYDAQGVDIGSIYYAWKVLDATKINPTNTSWVWEVLAATGDDIATYYDITANLRAAGPASGTLTATKGRKFAEVQLWYSTTPDGTAGTEYSIAWTCLAVYGRHGLTKRGTATQTDAQGFTAADVIRDIAQRWCPALNVSGVQDTTLVIPHIAFREPTHPYDAFKTLNAPHGWGLEVWEGRKLCFGPVDLSKADWHVRTDDPGMTWALQGDSTDDVANGIAVTYTDFAGKQHRLNPDTESQLAATDPNLSSTRHGLSVWTDVEVPFPCTRDVAVQVGRAALGEFNRPKAPGSIVVRGHISDHAGAWWPAWRPRAGETIAIADHPNDRPRLITETGYDHDSQAATITVDNALTTLDAVFDRAVTALQARGLRT